MAADSTLDKALDALNQATEMVRQAAETMLTA